MMYIFCENAMMKTCIVFTIESTCFTRQQQQHPGKQKQLNIYWVENIVFVILMLYGLFLWWMWLDTWIWMKWGRKSKSKSDVSSSGVVATSWPPAQLSSYFSLLVTFVFVTSIVFQLLSLLNNSAVTAMVKPQASSHLTPPLLLTSDQWQFVC